MALSLNAYKAISDSIAQQQNANTASFDAIQKARAEERQYLMDRLKWETDLGETERDAIRQQLDNGFGLGGIVKNMLGMNASNHDLAMDSSMRGKMQPQTLTAEEEKSIPKLTAQQEILKQLQGEYVGDTAGYNKTVNNMSQGIAEQRGLEGKATRNTPFADRIMANSGIKRNEEAIAKAETKRQEALAKKKMDSGEHYVNFLAEKGITIPDKLTGKFADQTGQLEQIYGTLIDEAVRNERWADARKFDREFRTNMKNVYKSWREDPRNIQGLFSEDMIPKSKGTGKPKLYTIKSTYINESGEKVTDSKEVALTDAELNSGLYSASTNEKMLRAGFSPLAIQNASKEILTGNSGSIRSSAHDRDEAIKYDKAYKLAMKNNGKEGYEYDKETGEVKIAGVSFFPPSKNYDYKIKQQKALEEE